MSKRRFSRISNIVGGEVEKYIPVDNPEHLKTIEHLKKQVEHLHKAGVQVIEKPLHIEKIVEKVVEDKELIERHNAALREIAQLKKFEGPTRVIEKRVEVPVEKVVEVPVEKLVEKIVYKIHVKLMVAASAASLIGGLLLGRIH